MHKFQEVLFGVDERTSDSDSREARLSALVRAAEASLPKCVLYPSIGSVTEVDSRTGSALEEIWRETAEINGGEYSPRQSMHLLQPMSNDESNPLCRGVYIFDREPEGRSFTVWDNIDGDALTAHTSDRATATAAANIVAVNRELPIHYVVMDLEDRAAQTIETRIKPAFEQAIADVRKDVLEMSAHDHIDLDALVTATRRLSALKALSEMAEDGTLPIDGMFIVEHAPGKLEDAETPEFLKALALRLADEAARTMYIDEYALKEITSDKEFWGTVDAQGLSGLEDACRASAEVGNPAVGRPSSSKEQLHR